ncbi:MAG: hypothetical protein Q8R87_10770, partial [Anaerolineaceae bacterium]|nr:hypothetical protein [Anaerolineaceae bacterium]
MKNMTETTQNEVNKAEKKTKFYNDNVFLSIKNLHVWFELRKWGFRHAGYVRAVDGVTFDLR